MSQLHSIKKSISKNVLKFPLEMYNSPHGSLIISSYILTKENKPTIKEIKSTWKKFLKNFNIYCITLDKEDFIPELCKLFKLPVPNNIAMVQSDFNVLFVPYIDGNIYPIREDGLYTRTLRTGKIYPINMEAK